MACLVKRNGVFTARVYSEGREIWRSLGTGDRQIAERKAREIEQKIKSRRWVRQELDQVLERAKRETQPDEVALLCETLVGSLIQFVQLATEAERDALALGLARRLTDQQQRRLSIKDAWAAWERSASRSTAAGARTIASYRSIWARFEDWAEQRGVANLHELDTTMACSYADALWAAPVTPRTFTAHLSFLRSVWRVLRVPAGLPTENPWNSIRGKQASQAGGRRDLTPAELRQVIGAASGPMRLLFLCGAFTGARLGDVVGMRWADIDLAAGSWAFVPSKTSRLGKKLALPLLDPLLTELRAAKVTSLTPHVFPEELKLWARGDLNRRIGAHFESCGIVTNEAVAEGSQRQRQRCVVGYHSLRHTAASMAAQSGVSLGLVQRALGHSTADMTLKYTHADDAGTRQVMSALADVINMPQAAKAEVVA